MRFLQLKEATTGMVFDQPVLDMLLLSAVVHPNQQSHRLRACPDFSIVGTLWGESSGRQPRPLPTRKAPSQMPVLCRTSGYRARKRGRGGSEMSQ